MGNAAKRWMFTCLVALFGCDEAAEQEMYMGAAGSPAFFQKPVVAADCPVLPPVSGLQLDSCCQSNGMCGVDISGWGRGCAPYVTLLASGLTPPPATQCSLSPAPTTAVGSNTAPQTHGAPSAPVAGSKAPPPKPPEQPERKANPATTEPEVAVYVDQSTRALAGGGTELVYDFVLLFRDGWSTWRMGTNVLENPAADRAAKPESWVTWRRDEKGEPERLIKDKWQPVRGYEHKPSAPGRTLSGEYVYRIIYSGQSVARFLTFKSNGQIESTNIVNSAVTMKQGTYRIDGFVLTLQWADGTTAKTTLVVYEGEDLIVFNGTGYSR